MNNCQKCGPIDPVETSYRTTQCGCTATSCNNIVSEGCVSGLKISNMPEPAHIAGDDLMPLVHHGSNVAITLEHFLLEASQILEKCPESALNISKEARDRALVALTTAEQACQTAKCAAQKAVTNADSISNIVEKDNKQDAQICTLQTQNLTLTTNIEQLQNSLEDCSKTLNVTVSTSPTATGDAIRRVQKAIPTNLSQLTNDSNYATITVGDSRWLLQTEAQVTYLTKADAALSYLDKESAANTYANINQVANKYLTKTSAADIYLTKNTASDTYATIADLTTKLNQITSSYQALAARVTALEANSTNA